MVENFETITEELTEEEMNLLPYVLNGFKTHKQENPIKAPAIVEAMNAKREQYGFKAKFTEARLRKFVNYIRTNALLPLIATSAGYFVTENPEVILSQIRSLKDRAKGIMQAADGLRTFIK
jgi:hypothetical protein